MIEIRSCSGFDEMEACVDLQIATWGYDASDVMPRKSFLVAQAIGGQVLGAFETGNREQGIGNSHPGGAGNREAEELVGFAFSLPGVKIVDGKPQPYLHSHMLAVREQYRNRGLGAQLKREQRLEALSRGIRHMEWTFDPLEIKNSFLNIHRLGAIARCYRVNFYGVSSSRLQGGLATDRLVAEWELDSQRVEAVLREHSAIAPKTTGSEIKASDIAGSETAEERILERVRERSRKRILERILVPAAIYRWKATEAGRKKALAVQLENRERFQEAFSRGLAVVGFSLDAEGNGVFELGSL